MRLDVATLRRFHVYADVLLVSASWLAAYYLRLQLDRAVGFEIGPVDPYLGALPLIVGPWIFCGWMFGLYRTTRTRTLVDQLQDLLRGSLLGLLVVSTLAFFFKELAFGRVVILLSAAFSFVLQGSSRALFFRVERGLQRQGRFDVPVLILGTGVTAMRLLQKLQDHPEVGYRIVGLVGDDADEDGGDLGEYALLGRVGDLPKIAREHGVQQIFIADPRIQHAEMLSLVLSCEELGVTFWVVTDLFEVLTAGSEINLVGDLPLVRLGRKRVPPLYPSLKRALDLLLGSALLLGSLPLWPWWALRIRLDSPGPFLFAQERVGQAGRRFVMYKLRTMACDTDPYREAPRDPGDDRVTRYGRWLRASSLDEVPQLWNVIRGDMSLVGPRPEMPFVVEQYDEWERRRLEVKPGITGLWQILGRKDLPMHDNLQYDFYYLRNRSLLLDLSILLRTVGAVLGRRGAF